MGRPIAFDREKAVETAMQEIWRLGYDAASVKAISERLRITRSSYYNAFGTREALFREAIARYCKQSPDSAFGEPLGEASPTALIASVFRAACAARAADPQGRGCMIVNGVAELCNVHQELGAFLETLVLGNIENIEALLEKAVARGEVPAEADLRTLAAATQSALMGLNVICKVVRREDELWDIARTTLRGLGLLPDDFEQQTER